MRSTAYLSVSASLPVLFLLIGQVSAQVTPDGSLPTRVQSDGNRTEVTGGGVAGTNLFYSFRDFSIPTGGVVHFNNAATVTNIINRVTGTSVSRIDGTIAANGTANVFLINPNGIIFGRNARLSIGGSFLATTANSIQFADGGRFSADAAAPPVLSVSVPVGLQFGPARGEIINRANNDNPKPPNNFPLGLQVPFGQTLALIGGNVSIEGGHLTAYGGRVAIGSVGDNSFVSLSADGRGWSVGYEGVSDFRNINLSNRATIDASGPGGTIDLRGRQIALEGDSVVVLTPLGLDNRGKPIEGSSGNVTVTASESISLTATAATSFSGILTQTSSSSNSGDIYVNTARLSILGGAQIVSGTGGPGNAGRIEINASESVEIVGTGRNGESLISNSTVPSPITPSVSRSGNGGDIVINTSRLIVRDGGNIQAGSADSTSLDPETFRPILGSDGLPIQRFGGRGGEIRVNATDSIEISGTGRVLRLSASDGTLQEVEVLSSISTSTGSEAGGLSGSSPAGNILLNTPRLRVADRGQISVISFQSSGAAGNLLVNAGSISLDNQARLIADSSSGGGGNIALNATEFLSLRRNSTISANAGNNGDGGNLIINTPFIFAVPSENSDITANAEGGRGGNVIINTNGIFGIQFRPEPTSLSDITVSSRFASSGTFTLNRLDVDPQSELVNLPTEVIDTENLIVRACGTGGRLARGEFTITGRGGLPADPDQTFESRDALADFGDRQPTGSASPARPVSIAPTETIIEATGWIVSDGQIVLTDRPSRPTSGQPPFAPPDCHLGANRS